jgi:hypothetical protein
MTIYRDSVCNVTSPRFALDRTAIGVLDALTATTGEVSFHDVDAAIGRAGGRTDLKSAAVKALRNMGYAIVTHKARHLSWYKLVGTPAEYEHHRSTMVRESYSRTVSVCRELAGAALAMPGDVTLLTVQRYGQMMAVGLGTDPAVGLTITEVVADLDPLPAR